MRFKQKPKPEHRDTRIKTKFLLLPNKIEGETRWLEKTSWKETCNKYYSQFWECWVTKWIGNNWID